MSYNKKIRHLAKGRSKTIAKAVLPVLALLIGVFAYKMLVASRPVPPSHVKRETVHPVRTMPIHLATHQPTLRLYGEIKAGRSVELRALVAGKVQKTGRSFREGASVKKGEVLFTIDPFNYKGAVIEAQAKITETRARLKEIKAQIKAEKDSLLFSREQLKLSQRDMKRAKRLVRKGSVTRQGADVREMVVSQRRQSLQGKQANLTVMQAQAEQQMASLDSLKWRLRQAKRNLHDTALRAPFAGYLSEPNANMGKLLNVNDKVAVLLDRHWMDVAFTLSDRQYGRLLEGEKGLIGRPIKVTWKLGAEQFSYKAVIERIGATISSETGGVAVYAKLQNPLVPRPVRVGAFVDVLVPDRLYKKVVKLPQSALYKRSKIYVVGADNRLHERLVTLRAIEDETVLVDGDVREGERVVVTRMSLIGAGMKVRDLNQPQKPPKKLNKPPSKKQLPAGKAKSRGEARKTREPAKVGRSAKKQRESRWQSTLGKGVERSVLRNKSGG